MSHADMMSAYYAAREAWEVAREAASHGYVTEQREYAEHTPPPRLAEFMTLQGH
jgi:hypothetical protein